MRIDCEQCSAAFTIDDALISDRGVRAQCPKCGHQRVVKKAPDTPNAFADAPSSAPSVNPFGGAPAAAASSPFGAPAAAAGNPFAGAPLAAPAPANPFGGAPAAGAGNPFGGAPSAAAGNPFGAPPAGNPFGAPPAAGGNPFGAPPAAGGNPFGASPAGASPFGAPPAGASPFGGAPTANPFGGAPSAPNPFGGAPSANSFGAPPAAAANPFGGPAPVSALSSSSSGANPFGGLSDAKPSPFGPPPSAPAANPFSAAPATGGADPFATLGNGPVASSGGAFGGDGDAFQTSPTSDAFGGGGGPAGEPGQWRLKSASGDEYLDVDALRDRVKAGTVKPDDLCGPAGETPKPAREHGALATAFGISKTIDRPRVSGARATGFSLSIPKPIMVAAAVVVLGVGGVFVVTKVKPEIFEKQSDAGINPLRRARTVWQRQFPDVEGTAQEHLVEGRKQMHLDTAAGYRKADDELRQSLLLDIGNGAAIAAWVENFASLPTVRADLEGSTLAREAVEYAMKREPDSPELLRAQGALKLALGDVDEAQRILNKAKAIVPGDVDTLVLLARSHLDRSPADALSVIQRDVRAKVPDLKVAYTIEGAAQRRLGAFKEAREMLEARLVSDPANVGALKEVAKLELDLGHADAALKALTKLLEAEDKDVEAHLLRAKITYQIKPGADGLKIADAQLTEVLSKHEGAAGDLLLSVLAHATFVKTRLGQVDEAIALGERARATDPAYPSALYALGRAYAAKGDLDNARKTLEQAVRATEQRDQFYEPLVRAELAAVQAKAGDEQNAIRNNEKVIEYDPRNIRAHFSLAAIFMKNNKATQAMTIMRRALANDPAWEKDRKVPTDYPTPASDLLPYADAFRDARIDSKDESLGSLRASAEGMIRYHAGEVDKASGLFQQALRFDRYNHAALLYQALIELDSGRVADARKHLRTAIETTASSHPVTKMYMARADLLSGDVEGARKRLQDLVETEPTLVQARYTLAMVLREQKLEAQARNELRAVVRQDPDYLPAKQALADKN